MTPDFAIFAAGINITSQIRDRLLSLTVTDEVGLKSDMLEITLDDRDNAIERPAPGAPLLVSLGYKESLLIPMGMYTADEISMKGPPATMIIRGKAANMGGTIKDQKTRSWEDKTIGDIVQTIAGEHGLEPRVAEAYRDIRYDYLDQTDESDLNFLIRIGRDHDAIVSVKGEALLFIGKGEGRTASGLPLPPRPVTRTGKTFYSCTLATRENFKSVEASWHDEQTGQKKKVTAGEGAPVKKLRHIYSGKYEAERAAKAKLDELTRGTDTFTVTMPGDPLIIAEGQIIATGFRPGIDGLWSVTSVTHSLTASGYTTTINAEKPKPEAGDTKEENGEAETGPPVS